MKTFYVTTPIYYANDKPHIGHAYTTVAADILKRWKTVTGAKAFLLTGTDEHGSKIAQAAADAGRTPQEFLDEMVDEFKRLWPDLSIKPDDFIRTTDERHMRGVQEIFSQLYRQGDIYKSEYEGLYCVPCETFFTDSQLVDGKCPDCKRKMGPIKEESYFFKLSQYQNFLLEHYRRNPEFLQPRERAPEMISFVSSGLRDLSVSRIRVPWGIPVPFDTSHTVYVWFDALLNYVTAAGYGTDNKRFAELWPADVHFVGKEIFKFHAVIWPAMLKAANLSLPKKVFAHGWWTVEGEKMSKSRGNVIDPREIAGEYSVDVFRYFIFREMPFGSDGNFTREALRRRYNAELANDLGNLFSRTITMVEKYCSGKVPPGSAIDESLREPIISLANTAMEKYEQLDFYNGLITVWKIVECANQYIEQKAPWNIPASRQNDRELVLKSLLWILSLLSILLYPFMPSTAEEMWRRLGYADTLLSRGPVVISAPGTIHPTAGTDVIKGAALFPRK